MSIELHPHSYFGAVRSTTVSVESQLVTDGKVVTGSWCRMCCSRELSRSSVTPALYSRRCTCVHSLYSCTLWTPGPCPHTHLDPVVAASLPPPASSPPHTRPDISQWRPQHLSISAQPPSGSVLVGSPENRTTFYLTHLHLSFAAAKSVFKTTHYYPQLLQLADGRNLLSKDILFRQDSSFAII